MAMILLIWVLEHAMEHFPFSFFGGFNIMDVDNIGLEAASGQGLTF